MVLYDKESIVCYKIDFQVMNGCYVFFMYVLLFV